MAATSQSGTTPGNLRPWWVTAFPLLVVFVAFGIWFPLQKGITILDPVFLGAYICLGVVFAAPAAVLVPKGVRFAELLWRMGWAVGRGFAISAALLVSAVVTVYATHIVVVGPDPVSLAECAVFGLGLSAAVVAVVTFLTIYVSVAVARIATRLILLGLLGLFFFWSRWLPDIALKGAAISAAVALVFLGVLWKTSRPT
ncbi:MAG: hypothetical protein ABI811_18020 [Acidobacteriota bacterium]